jgi:hypothetical protein
MNEVLLIVVVVAAWIVLQAWILPRAGIPT